VPQRGVARAVERGAGDAPLGGVVVASAGRSGDGRSARGERRDGGARDDALLEP
jgi:hypothetical protein